MFKFVTIGLLAGHVAAAPAPIEEVTVESCTKLFDSLDNETSTVEGQSRRELFPLYSVGTKCARRGCSIYQQISRTNPMMAMGDANAQTVQGPVKALEMLALNDDLNTVVQSDSYCTRRHAMSRAAGLAAGLALASVNQPSFAAETKQVKMGSDSGQLVFVPDEIKICKGDSVTWTNNKGGPHNVVFDEDAIPSGVDQAKISMDDQLGDEGATFSMKFDTAGSYSYYCEPHRGAGMLATLQVQ